MRAFSLLWSFLRLGIMTELAYRMNFLLQCLQSLLQLGIALAGLAIVFTHTHSLGGWQPAQLLALLGVYMLVGGMINLVIQPSMQQLMEDVQLGTLDFTLIKPEDTQLLVSVQRVSVWKIVDIVLGVVVLGGALLQLGTRVGVWHMTASVLNHFLVPLQHKPLVHQMFPHQFRNLCCTNA